MNLKVDIYNCEGCGRAVVVEFNQEVEICPYQDCAAPLLEYSHSGHVLNEREC
jgi:hypothetical protein